MLGELSDEDAELVLGELRRELATGDADLLRLRGPRGRDRRCTAPPRVRRRGALRERSAAAPAHWELAVPDSYDAFLSSLSKSTRESAKRYPKKLEKEFGDRLTLEVFRDVADSERVFTDLRRVAEKTYQQGLGVSFAQTELQHRLTTLTMERGWFRAYVLYLDDEPIAFWQGQAYNGVFSTGVPGFDPAYADHRVGNYVLFKLIADLCADESIDTLDYGFGDAEYKRRFGTPQLGRAGRAPLRPDGQGLPDERDPQLAARRRSPAEHACCGRNDRLDRIKKGVARPALARRRRDVTCAGSSSCSAASPCSRPRWCSQAPPSTSRAATTATRSCRGLARADLVAADGARRLPRLEPVHHARERERAARARRSSSTRSRRVRTPRT